MTLLIVSLCFSAIVGLLIALLFYVPASSREYSVRGTDVSPGIAKLVKMFGSDVLSLTPANVRRKHSKDEEVEKLIKKAGNPWNITARDYFVIRIVLAFFGLIVGAIFGFLMHSMTDNKLFLIIGFVIMPLVGWIYPKSVYTSAATKRDLEFKKALPQAIDLLIMALSGGGYTLQNAIEEILKYMEPSPVKDEFHQIVQDVKSGITLTDALDNFADRVSTESIQSFVRALNNAQRLSVPMLEILRARSVASRKEIRAEAEARIQKLPMKMMLAMSPTSVIAVSLVAVSPSLFQLIGMLG